jgi:hypothetical protein
MRITLKTAALLAVLAAAGAVVLFDPLGEQPAAPKGAAPKVVALPDRAPPKPSAAPSSFTPPAGTTVVAAPKGQASPAPAAALPDLNLPARGGLTESKSPMFDTRSWVPPPPKIVPQKAPPPPPPTAPPLPYKFVGRMLQDGQLYVFLAKGDSVSTVKQGDTLDGVYRVEAVTETEVALNYTPLGQKQTLAVVSSLPGTLAPAGATARAQAPPSAVTTPPSAAASPPPRTGATSPLPTTSIIGGANTPPASGPAAQLEWTGPNQVKVGASFNVSLRVKSSEMLHAWPMQLRFDPALFDVLTVKPGGTVSGPTFGYRVNEDGSIFVGASAQSGTSAANTELVVVTLRSLKAAPAAEMSVSSLTLQGAAGRAIPYDRIASFKTAIVP